MTSAQAPQRRVDSQTFLQSVRQSGLIDEEKLKSALARIPTTDRGRVLARALVELRLLTKFQAERLLAGITDGFCMGQYRILDELGRGGMGRVFKAEHMTMNRTVALKVLNPNLMKTESARQLFEREVKAAAKLTHPNIVTAFDANQVDDRWYLVMEFVDGPNLQDLVRDNGSLPVAQACDYIRQAALGLEYAHGLGLIHRDIKPANLLVQKSQSRATSGAEVVKILDFGLARLSEANSDGSPGADSIHAGKQTVMGTPDYLSPEQAKNLHSTDGRSDLYSLGCTLYYLLTGQVVFPGGTTMEKLVRHTTEQPPSIKNLRPDVPDDVAGVIAALLQKDPNHRFRSAGELANLLTAIAIHESGKWVEVDTLPIDHTLPVSGTNLAGVGQNDPWAGIDYEENESDPGEDTTPTDEDAYTYVEESGRRNPRKTTRKQEGLGAWMWIMPLLILGVAAGVVLSLRAIMK
jgi:serine/threonine-protein kinase